MTAPQPQAAKAPPASAISPGARALLQRKCACGVTAAEGECEGCRRKRLQRKASGAMPDALPSSVHRTLQEPGRPMGAPERAMMESRFGHDFSGVRVHADGLGAQSARDVGALAYTVGDHVVFGQDQYRPQGSEGQRLLAHELTHTLQQRQAPQGWQGKVEVGAPDTAAEREADAVADHVMSHPRAYSPIAVHAEAATLRRRVSPALPRLQEDLSSCIFNGVNESEARDVLATLSPLSETDLTDTVEALEADSGAMERFFEALPAVDARNHQDDLRRIQNHRVFRRTTRDQGVEHTTVIHGSCSFDQFDAVRAATTTATTWLNQAVTRMDAYRAAPAAQLPVGTAIQSAFATTAPDVVAHIRARIAQIRTDLTGMPGLRLECHGNWDTTCPIANAYIPGGDPERVVFCPIFFGWSQDDRAASLIHEFAHTQVGGAHITDRSYLENRLIDQLSTAEALTNAASYERLVRNLATGTDPARPVRDSFEDCPADWQTQIREAAARTERYVRNADSHFSDLTAATLTTRLTPDEQALMPSLNQAGLDRAQQVMRDAENKFGSNISYECEDSTDGRCATYTTYWYALGDFHICRSWHLLPTAEARQDALLAGLLGYWGIEDDNAKRNAYAQLARRLTNRIWAAPTLARVMGGGGTGWSANDIHAELAFVRPTALSHRTYRADATPLHLPSTDLPHYEGPDCTVASLPIVVRTWFYVDQGGAPRPLPFAPPTASVAFDYSTPTPGLPRSESEPRARYESPGSALGTRIPEAYAFNLPGNADFHLRIRLQDPDSGITRTLEDTLPVVASRPCAAASLVRDPRAHVQTEDAQRALDLQTFLEQARSRIRTMLLNPTATLPAWARISNPNVQSMVRLLNRLITGLDEDSLILRFDQSAGGMALAHYDPSEDVMHLRPPASSADLPLLAANLVHEYAHAMQDEAEEALQISGGVPGTHTAEQELQQEIEGRRQESYFLQLWVLSDPSTPAPAPTTPVGAAAQSATTWVGRFEQERTGSPRAQRTATADIRQVIGQAYATQIQANAPALLYPLEISETNHAVLHRQGPAGAALVDLGDLGADPAPQTLEDLSNRMQLLVRRASFFADLFRGTGTQTISLATFTVYYRQRRLTQFTLPRPTP